MRKSKLLSKLLSGVCCLAMLMTMLPIVPVAAADNAVLFQDDFNSYSANADLPMGDKFKLGSTQVRKDAATPGSYSFTTANGALKLSATDVVDSGDMGEVYAGVATTATFGGSYTLTFDWMQETEDVYCTILYLAGTEVRVRMQNPTSTSALYNTVFFVKDGNKYLTNPDSGAQFKFGAAFGTWYTFEYFVDADAASVTLNVYDKASGEQLGTYTLKSAPVDDKGLEIRHFGVQGNDEAGKTSTCWVDNLKVVSGIVETDREGGAATGTTISGGSLNSFSDSAEITYTKAAEITAGLGLFAGADGKFMPKGTVTRAQMATIIVKMLNGADANADTFKGTGKFNDVAGFEGGWAEGYVNWCSTLGIVSGYGDGTFRPGNQVTAAEAATMILNALKVDAGAGTWPHTVMAKAEELNMFDDLLTKPANDKPLSREELAVMALVGLEYSPEGKQGYEYNGVTYDSFMDAYMVAGPTNAGKINPTAGDSLAGKVFEMQTFEGFIVDNQATDPELAGLTVVSKKVDGVNVDKTFFIPTGLEHVGHYVTVYYSETYTSERDPGLTYTIYDETQVFAVDEAITTAKEYKKVFDRSYKAADKVALFGGNYVSTDLAAGTLSGYTAGSAAKPGTYFVYDGAIVAYMDAVTVKATRVQTVSNYEDNETITLKGISLPISNSEDNDRVVEYAGIAKGDYITYTVVGEEGHEIYVLSKTTPVSGAVTKVTTNEEGDRVVTVKGEQYVDFGTENNDTDLAVVETFDFTATYTFYVTADGKFVGCEKTDGVADLTNTVFVLGTRAIVETDSYGKRVLKTYARGVDMDGKEVMLPVRVQSGTKSGDTFTPDGVIDVYHGVSEGAAYAAFTDKRFYGIELSKDKEAKKEGLYELTAIASEYEKETAPIYQGAKIGFGSDNIGDTDIPVGKMISYKQSTSLYLTMEGSVDQDEPLTATVKKGSRTSIPNQEGESAEAYFILSRSAENAQMIEVMLVLLDEKIMTVADGQGVYISDNWRDTEGRSASGYTYEVYDYAAGTPKSIMLDKQLSDYDAFTGAGFYKIVSVEDEEYMTIHNRVPGSASPKEDISSTGQRNKDGFPNEHFFYDQIVAEIVNNKLTTVSLTKFGAYGFNDAVIERQGKPSGAIVVDLRTEEDITAHGVGKITSLDRVLELTSEDPERVIPVDICYSTANSAVLTVFVKDLYYSTAAQGISMTGTSALNGRLLADGCVVENQTGADIDTTSVATAFADLDRLLHPEDPEEGYPADFPWTITLEYEMVGGKITRITAAKAVRPGLIFSDTFNSYTVNKFDNDEYPWVKVSATGDASGKGTIKADGADRYFRTTEGRFYVKPATPEGAYTMEFDIRRTLTGDKLYGSPAVWIGNVNGNAGNDNLRLTIAEDTSEVYLKVGSAAHYLLKSNKFSTSKTNAVTIDAGDWWHLKLTIDPDSGDVTVSANERGSDTVYSASMNVGVITSTAYTSQIDIICSNKTAANSATLDIDNILFEMVRSHKYPVDVDPAIVNGTVTTDVDEAATGTVVTVDIDPDPLCATKEVTVTNRDGSKLPVEEVAANKYTFVMGVHPVTVSATFEQSYAINLTQPTQTGAAIDAVESAAEGATVTVTATLPTTGFWKLGTVTVTTAGGTVAAEITDKTTATFTMPAEAVTVSVTFADDSVVFEDDFSSYNVGQFVKEGVSANQGARYAVCSGQGKTAFEAEVTEGKELKATGGRLYLGQKVIPAAGTYSYEFDIKLTGDPSATIYRIGDSKNVTLSGGAWRVYIHKDSRKIYLYREGSKDREGNKVAAAAYYLQKDGTFGTSTNAVTVGADEWWHIAVTVDYDGFVTISAGKKGETTVSGTYNIGEPFVPLDKNGSAMLDLNTNSGNGPIYIDNIKITKVWAN